MTISRHNFGSDKKSNGNYDQIYNENQKLDKNLKKLVKKLLHSR